MLKNIKNPVTIILQLIREIVSELKQVDYLSRSKTIKYTVFIVVSLVLATLFLILVDRFLFSVRNLILQF